VDFLKNWYQYERNVDYDIEHLGGADFGASATQFGFSPGQVVQQFQAGGAINVGLHAPGFGHVVVLDNAILLLDGTAMIRIMDPNQEPPQPVGIYRWLHLNQNGTVDWVAANPGYFDGAPPNGPAGGTLNLDELLILRDCHWFNFPSPKAPEDGRGGTVPGDLDPDGHTWRGRFLPPAGSPGPWLLTSVTTDSSGHTMREHRLIGARP
jgi:hypothetical protein